MAAVVVKDTRQPVNCWQPTQLHGLADQERRLGQ